MPLRLWAIVSLLSLLLSPGLARSLRGAFVGAQRWIAPIDQLADRLSQLSAILTALLLVYVGLLAIRAARTLSLGAVSALLGAPATMLLFFAYRFDLPQAHTWFAALCASFALLLGATQARSRPIIRTVMTLGALTLFSEVLRTTGDGLSTPILNQLGGALRVGFAWGTLLTTLLWHLWANREQYWRGPILLGAATLLAATPGAASSPDASRSVLVVGRSLSELAPPSSLGSGAPLLLSLALCLLVSAALRPRSSLGQLLSATLCLACIAPTAPLVVGWVTLCGFACLVICWVPAPHTRPQEIGIY